MTPVRSCLALSLLLLVAVAPAADALPAKRVPAQDAGPAETAPERALREATDQRSAYIIGGTPVPAGTAPASIVRLLEVGDNGGFCGGTLASALVVVTAAHCVDWLLPSEMRVLVGSAVRGGLGGRRVAVSAIELHPDYDGLTLDNDVAVLLLAKPQPGPYATFATSPPASGDAARVYGWGQTASGISPFRLFSGSLAIQDHAGCDTAMGAIGAGVTPTMLCAGAEGRGGCYGDSGGPLFTGTAPALVQVGIVSWGHEDCLTLDQGFPTVFSDVAALGGFLAPFLANSAPLQLDLKQPWVLDGFFTVSNGEALVDECWVYLSVSDPVADCGGSPVFISGRSPVLLLPPLPLGERYTVAFTAGSGEPLSVEAVASATPKANAVTKVALDPKPLFPVVQVKADAVYAFVTMTLGGDTCWLAMYTPADAVCDGTDFTLLGLSGNRVMVLGDPLPTSLTFAGGGYTDIVDPIVVTNDLEIPVALRPGGVVSVAPRFTLQPGYGGLDLKGAKAAEWDATFWFQGSGDVGALCRMVLDPAYHSADCLGSVVGLRGGKVLFPVDADGGAADIEASQTVNGVQTVAVAENVAIRHGVISPVTLRFGPAPSE